MKWHSDYEIKPHYVSFQAIPAVSDETSQYDVCVCVCACFYIIHTFQSASIFTDYDADEYPSVKTSVHSVSKEDTEV